jgi:hypothetical protein
MPAKSFTQDLSAGPLSVEFVFVEHVRLNQVFINASVNITENITVTLKSTFGTNYDIILDFEEMTAKGDYAYIPDRRPTISDGDSLLIECTNANTTGIVYGTYHVESRGN